jgi:dimethylamine/trimethylamine dehydrogenase
MIGAARPSIADPFLPNKIAAGDIDDIRECIGCNVCVTGDYTMTPIRCTQNPTMGEEWRKGWHPERVPARSGNDTFLIVGAGPAGLECARVLGQRGYQVHLAEAREALGGRVAVESRLPGLSAWGRVRDYRVNQLSRMQNVEILRGSRVSAAEILEFGASRVVLATGARWKHDGVGRANTRPIPGFSAGGRVLTPDDLHADAALPGPVVVFDDDHYYLGAVLAEKLRKQGHAVTLVTPSDRVSAWTVNTLEQYAIHKRTLGLGIEVLLGHNVVGFDGSQLTVECTLTDRRRFVPAATVVTLTAREPNEELALQLQDLPGAVEAAGVLSVSSVGDCWVPSTIAAAVYAGHRYGRELGAEPEGVGFRRELTSLIESEGA